MLQPARACPTPSSYGQLAGAQLERHDRPRPATGPWTFRKDVICKPACMDAPPYSSIFVERTAGTPSRARPSSGPSTISCSSWAGMRTSRYAPSADTRRKLHNARPSRVSRCRRGNTAVECPRSRDPVDMKQRHLRAHPEQRRRVIAARRQRFLPPSLHTTSLLPRALWCLSGFGKSGFANVPQSQNRALGASRPEGAGRARARSGAAPPVAELLVGVAVARGRDPDGERHEAPSPGGFNSRVGSRPGCAPQSP
jgi:hypothetical protein